jgi:hypothetical protein
LAGGDTFKVLLSGLAIVAGLHHPHHPFARAEPCQGIVGKEINSNIARVVLARGSGGSGAIMITEIVQPARIKSEFDTSLFA